jgi:methionyl-tRNA synthetase
MATGLESIFPGFQPWMIIAYVIAIIWTAIWKACALWKSARLNQKVWFIILLIVNTLGILEILYIFVFSKCCNKLKPTPKPKLAKKSVKKKKL